MDHKHVTKYYQFEENAAYEKANQTSIEYSYIAMEHSLSGNLFDFVAWSGAFSDDVCRLFFSQLIQGVKHIHEQGYSHRDLKPQNLLLNDEFDLKICDFGFASPLTGDDGNGMYTEGKGTPEFMAPEIFTELYKGEPADLWACGVILFCLRSEHTPFKHFAHSSDPYFNLLLNGRQDLFWKAHEHVKEDNYYSDDFKDLINGLLTPDPELRLNMHEISSHPWFSGPVPSQESIAA